MASKILDTYSWEYTQRIIRIYHNREVKKWFKDVISDNASTTGRQQLKTAFLIRDADSAIEVQNKILGFQTYCKKFTDVSAVATVPESWTIRAISQRPQLIIIFKPSNSQDGKGYYPISLPHYDGGKSPNIKPYTKGNCWAKLILKDNSQIIINGKTEKEAIEQIKDFHKYINNKYKPLIDSIKTGKYQGKLYKEIKMKPFRADYYSKGAKNAYPDWQHYF